VDGVIVVQKRNRTVAVENVIHEHKNVDGLSSKIDYNKNIKTYLYYTYMTYNISDPTVFRENLQKKYKDVLQDETMAINMEKAVYNYTIREATQRKIVKKWENRSFAHIYVDRTRTIWINLKNTGFLQKLLSKEISPHDAAFMTHQEMNETHWQELIEKKKILDANRFNNNNAEASTTLFTCSRCKSNKCTFYSLQIRSCDEGETIFVSCTNCGKRWKKNS